MRILARSWRKFLSERASRRPTPARRKGDDPAHDRGPGAGRFRLFPKPEWVARFTINAMPVLLKLAAKRGCPTTGSLEYLNTAGWTLARPVVVALRDTRKHEAIAAEAAKLAAQGACTDTIRRVLGTTWSTAKEATEFSKAASRCSGPGKEWKRSR